MKIFISYRRDDSLAIAGRIYDRLRGHFGRGTVFMDLDAIPVGEDFREVIQDAINEADVLLALIGTDWLGQDQRLQSQKDLVRAEIETALNQRIPVVPILLDTAVMPSEDDLPEAIREIAFRNALRIDSGQDFDMHMSRLVEAIKSVPKASKPPPLVTAGSPRNKWMAAVLFGVGICAITTVASVAIPAVFRKAAETPTRDEDTKRSLPSDDGSDETGIAQQPQKATEVHFDDGKTAGTPLSPTLQEVDQAKDAPKKPVATVKSAAELKVLIQAKKDELGNLLVKTLISNSSSIDPSEVEIAMEGKDIVVKIRLRSGPRIHLAVSPEGVQRLSVHDPNDPPIRIEPALIASTSRKVESLLQLTK